MIWDLPSPAAKRWLAEQSGIPTTKASAGESIGPTESWLLRARCIAGGIDSERIMTVKGGRLARGIPMGANIVWLAGGNYAEELWHAHHNVLVGTLLRAETQDSSLGLRLRERARAGHVVWIYFSLAPLAEAASCRWISDLNCYATRIK